MSTNPILEELHAVREQLLAEHGGDLAELLRSLADEGKSSDHPVANITPRKINRKTPPPFDPVAPETPSTPAAR
ncbi:hypothetical protein [Anatilimnocola floriformis]|uniref:hypothetical protein n=1 Tax=Anatilimnocola floriformis TaxID=2948575 RepID=UPI0020C3ECC2|nr:hypothetical protein [Anatilimnocola floriformis]